MTYSGDRRDDYAHPGQQDDYFEQDLAIAGQDLHPKSPPENPDLEDYQHQGQQDDYFEQDLSRSDGA